MRVLMIWRLILFLISIGYYSFTHDLWGILCVMIVVQCIQIRLCKKEIIWTLVYPLLVVSAAVMSVRIYDMRYTSALGDTNTQTILMTGIVLNHTKQWQYEFEDVLWRSWILKSDAALDIGQAVRVSGKLQRVDLTQKQPLGIFDYDRWLKMKWYVGQIQAVRVDVVRWSWPSIIFRMRNRVSKQITMVFGASPQAWLLHGMLVGSKRNIPKEQYDGFIRSGLVHLIAVSWGNVMMVSIFLGRLLCRVPYYIRLCLISIGIVRYGMLCGADSSVVRAVLMGLLWLIALFMGKMIDTLRVVAMVMVVMLLRNPYYLIYDMGFVLSFAAVTGVIILSNWRQCKRAVLSAETSHIVARWCYDSIGNYIIPTLGVTLGVLPVLLLFSWWYNLTGLLGNIMIMPLVPIIMISGVVALISYGVRGSDMIISGTSWLLQIIYYMSDWINEHGYRVVSSHGFAKLFIIASCLYCLWRFHELSYRDFRAL